MPGSDSRLDTLMRPMRLILLLGLGSTALIAGAWWSQLVWHLVPCKLCLEQRIPHYAAMALAAVALVVARSRALQLTVLA
ncbi:disulfide bond formation protein B, partial [Lysobacter sp. TAB13]